MFKRFQEISTDLQRTFFCNKSLGECFWLLKESVYPYYGSQDSD